MEAIEVFECILCLLKVWSASLRCLLEIVQTHIEDIVVHDVCCPPCLGPIAYPDLPDPSIPPKELVDCRTRPNQPDFRLFKQAKRRTIFSFGLEVEVLAVENTVSICQLQPVNP
jgi:hypothetical protein